MSHTITTLPPVTIDHVHKAFVLLAVRGQTFTDFLQNPRQLKVLHACAAHIRTQEWERTTRRTVVPVPRVRLGADGHPMGWCTQMVPGARVSAPQVDFFNHL